MCRKTAFLCILMSLSTQVVSAQPGGPGGSQPRKPAGGPRVAPPPAPPPPSRSPQYSLLTALIPYLGEESIQQELKLNEEQRSRLLIYSQKVLDDTFRANAEDTRANAPMQNEATDAFFAKTLSFEQLQRAHQIAARLAWRERGFSRYGGFSAVPNLSRLSVSTLAKYPELITSLNLSPDQQKLVELAQPYSTGFLFLTPEQSKIAASLMGSSPEKPLPPLVESRTIVRPERPQGRALNLTASNDVRSELALNDQQMEELARLRDWWRDNRLKIQRESRQIQKQKIDELATEVGARLAAILRQEQHLRLMQIERRVSLPREDVLQDPGLARELGLNDDQRAAVAQALETCGTIIQKAILNGTDVEAAEETIHQAIAHQHQVMDNILTANQKTRLRELLGEPFRGSPYNDLAQTLMNPQEVEYGLYTNELAFLSRNTVVQGELQMTSEQIEAATSAARNVESKFTTKELYSPSSRGADRKAYEERSAAIEKAIQKILTAEQSQRFHQLMIQSRDQLSRPRFDSQPVSSVVAYPGVAEAIKLTQSQKEQLHSGLDPDLVFTPEQKAAITALKGELVQGDLTPPNQRASLLVQSEGRYTHLLELNWAPLKLTPEEVAKLVPVITRFQLATQPSAVIQELGGEKDKLGTASQRFDRAVSAILTPAQLKALDQFKFQEAAASSYRTALARPEARVLALSPAQLQDIATLEARNRQWVRLATRAQDYLPAMMPLEALLMALRERLDEKILATFNDDQRGKWNDLNGGPWADLRKNTSIRLGKMATGSDW